MLIMTSLRAHSDLLLVYAFRAREVTDYLSIAVLAMYIIIAVSHAAFNIARGRSSHAWEKLEDFASLLLHSKHVPDSMANTCAGIESARVKAMNARAVVVVVGGGGGGIDSTNSKKVEGSAKKEGEGGGGGKPDDKEQGASNRTFLGNKGEEEVQLVFSDDSMNKSPPPWRRVKPDIKYGKID